MITLFYVVVMMLKPIKSCMVGELHYLTFTKPDISYVASKVSSFMHSPTNTKFAVVKRILGYVKRSITAGVLFKADSSLTLSTFSVSDWAGYKIDRRSLDFIVCFSYLPGSPRNNVQYLEAL